MEGRILSIETMGLRDGPGIRTVIFMQGCHLRCRFCHNPDSWNMTGGRLITPEELLAKAERFRPYFSRSGGGITFSGGEPLLQPEFLLEALALCREAGIHTCIDTAGVGVGRYEEILSLTDLVLYDVKATDPAEYRALCAHRMEETLRFEEALRHTGTETVVRHVVVPGRNDSDEAMLRLRAYIKEHLPHVKTVELIPYHKMGVFKYTALGMTDPLEDTPPMDPARTEELKKRFFE